MSILRTLTAADDSPEALSAAALLVRRAGLEGLVTSPTGDDIQALGEAGDTIAMERIVFFIWAVMNPTKAIAPFDGGKALREQSRALAYASSEKIQ